MRSFLMSFLLLVCYSGLSNATKLDKPAMRIVALSPHAVELLFAIGAGDRIVGTVEYANYPEAALDIRRIGGYRGVQIEHILELKPDLVVVWKGGNQAADIQKLESLGFPIHNSQPLNISQISEDLMILGELTGLQNNAKKTIEQLAIRYKNIKQKYATKAAVKVFYQIWHEPLKSVGSNSWVESLINDCHGNNIFHEANVPYPQVSLESILVKNPEVIIIPHHSGSKVAKRQIWNDWSEISAVKNERIFVLNGDLMLRPTPRALDGLEMLCEKINTAR